MTCQVATCLFEQLLKGNSCLRQPALQRPRTRPWLPRHAGGNRTYVEKSRPSAPHPATALTTPWDLNAQPEEVSMKQNILLKTAPVAVENVPEGPHEEVLLKAGALQHAIFKSANFAS